MRHAVGVFAAMFKMVDESPRILLLRRSDGMGWNLPGGGVKKGETLQEALAREVREETGLEIIVKEQIFGSYEKIEGDEVEDVAYIFLCEISGNFTPQKTQEAIGHCWLALDDILHFPVIRRPCPGYPEGRTIVMIKDGFRHIGLYP